MTLFNNYLETKENLKFYVHSPISQMTKNLLDSSNSLTSFYQTISELEKEDPNIKKRLEKDIDNLQTQLSLTNLGYRNQLNNLFKNFNKKIGATTNNIDLLNNLAKVNDELGYDWDPNKSESLEVPDHQENLGDVAKIISFKPNPSSEPKIENFDEKKPSSQDRSSVRLDSQGREILTYDEYLKRKKDKEEGN